MARLTERRALVAANWKMNGQKARVASLVRELCAGIAGLSALDVVVCPPAVYLAEVQAALKGSSLGLGAQNLHSEDEGAFTGEISAPMLNDFACSHVIVGHSERRKLFGESDNDVAAKFIAAGRHALVPILCVGESAAQRKAGSTEKVVGRQVEAVLKRAGIGAFARAVIAYEPVWAIGSGRAATPDKAQAVHALIRATLARHDADVAERTRIVYGGSVNAANAPEFYAQPDIDGALVGGASLIAKEFVAICRGIAATRKLALAG